MLMSKNKKKVYILRVPESTQGKEFCQALETPWDSDLELCQVFL